MCKRLWLILALCAAIIPAIVSGQAPFIRGDVNTDGVISMADGAYLGAYMFAALPESPCLLAGDANVDGVLNIADEVKLFMYAAGRSGAEIPSFEDVPPEYESSYMTCSAGLSSSPAVDSGVALYLDEVAGGAGDISVALRFSGVNATLAAWRCKVLFPAEMLEFVTVHVPGTANQEIPSLVSKEVTSPGTLALGVAYSLDAIPGTAYPVTEGTTIADLVFRPTGQPSGRVALAFAEGYGASEVVLEPERPTVFAAAAAGAVLFGDQPLPAPTDFAATVQGGEVRLSWKNQTTAGNVVVERDGHAIATLAGTATSHVDTPPSAEHAYRVRATQGTRTSCAPFAFAPVWTLAPPSETYVTIITLSSIRLGWENGAPYDTVQIFRDGALLAEIPGTSTTYTDETRVGDISVYHLRGVAGSGVSVRVPILCDTGAVWNTEGYGENGVESLSRAFTGPGEVTLTWDPAPAGADSYEIVRNNEVLTRLDANARNFTDNPALEKRNIRYEVRTVAGGEIVAGRLCGILFDRSRAIRLAGAQLSPDLSSVEIQWENLGAYLGIIVTRNGNLETLLPGDATSRVIDRTVLENSIYAFRAYGEDYFTDTVELNGSGFSTIPFLRGDVNQDGLTSISDVLYLRRYLFTGGMPPGCMRAADADADDRLNIADAVIMLTALFSPDVILPEPYPVPGLDLAMGSLTCETGTIVPGTFTDDLIRVGEVEGAPGEEVMIPVFITNTVPVEAFQLVITYDPDFFTPCQKFGGSATCPGLIFDGSAFLQTYGEVKPEYSALYAPAGEDYFIAGAMWAFAEDKPIPVGTDQLLATIVGRVSENAQPGQVIDLEPTNGPDNEGVGIHRLHNEITSRGESRYVSFYPQTRKGMLFIKDNPVGMDFMRGDVNLDVVVNIADPIALLSYLFNKGKPPLCPDAADVGDDGDLNIADAVSMLAFLFSPPGQSGGIPTDIGTCVRDRNPDGLGACYYPSCKP
jgi:hypothetical protein